MSLMQKHGLWVEVRAAENTGCLQVHFFQQAAPRVGVGAIATMKPQHLGGVSWIEATTGRFPSKLTDQFSQAENDILYHDVVRDVLKQCKQVAPSVEVR